MSLFIWRFGRDESRRQLPKGFLPKVTPPQDHKDDFLGDGLGNSIQRDFLGGGERPPLPQSFVNVIQKKFVQHIISNDPWKGVTSTLPVTKPVIAPPGGRPLWAFWGGVACFQGLCMCPPPCSRGWMCWDPPSSKKPCGQLEGMLNRLISTVHRLAAKVFLAVFPVFMKGS